MGVPSEMNIDEVKQFIKDNLVLEVEYTYPYEPGQIQTVKLSFRDDKESFTDATIYINGD